MGPHHLRECRHDHCSLVQPLVHPDDKRCCLGISCGAFVAILTGVFFAVRFTACGARRAGIGGVLSFIGIACPVCNKILMLIFGGPLLLAYFDPVRPYVALAGLILLAVGIYRNIAARRAALATAWVMS